MKYKHKHADLIEAWANGAQIQWKDPDFKSRWSNCTEPSFYEEHEYRINPKKKQPVMRWKWAFIFMNHPDNGWYVDEVYLTEEEAVDYFLNEYTEEVIDYIKLEFTRKEFSK